jgi:hypothetical protein
MFAKKITLKVKNYNIYSYEKLAVFHTSRGTSSLSSIIKIRVGMVFFIGSLDME